MTIQELRKRSNDFVANLAGHVESAVMENERKIVAMNQEQMRLGKKADGSKIGFLASITYARQKIDRGGRAPFRIPDLFNTGEFQSKMTLSTNGATYYEIGSTDDKAFDLESKYGSDIFGLMPTWHEEARQLTGNSLARIYNSTVLR